MAMTSHTPSHSENTTPKAHHTSLIALTDHDIRELSTCPRGIAVACSGGKDSTALLHSFYELHQSQKLPASELIILHVNVQLRGDESQRDEDFVARLAESYSLPFHTYYPSSPFSSSLPLNTSCPPSPAEPRSTQPQQDQPNSTKNSRHKSPEAWARQIRLEAYRLWMSRGYAIAVGHHEGDHAENILFRLIRASHPWNHSGMTRWRGGIFRPLLSTPPAKIKEYSKAHRLSWVEDSTNSDKTFARNRLRHDLIGGLTEIQSGAVRSMISSAETSRAMAHTLRKYFRGHIRYPGRTMHLDGILPDDGSPGYEGLMQLALEALCNHPLQLSGGMLGEIRALVQKSRQTSQPRDSPQNSSRSTATSPSSPYVFPLPQGTLYFHDGHVMWRTGLRAINGDLYRKISCEIPPHRYSPEKPPSEIVSSSINRSQEALPPAEQQHSLLPGMTITVPWPETRSRGTYTQTRNAWGEPETPAFQGTPRPRPPGDHHDRERWLEISWALMPTDRPDGHPGYNSGHSSRHSSRHKLAVFMTRWCLLWDHYGHHSAEREWRKDLTTDHRKVLQKIKQQIEKAEMIFCRQSTLVITTLWPVGSSNSPSPESLTEGPILPYILGGWTPSQFYPALSFPLLSLPLTLSNHTDWGALNIKHVATDGTHSPAQRPTTTHRPRA